MPSLIHGDALETLKTLPPESVDSFVSDIPYGLGSRDPKPEEILKYLQGEVLKTGDFKGADWDIPSVETWREVHRVVKPGAYLAVFGGTRTFDLISLGLRMAGFHCHDSISLALPVLQWTYSSGMPKGGKAFVEGERLGTGLKPSWEPVMIFQKPFKGSLRDNREVHGTGFLRIDAARVLHANKEDFEAHKSGVDKIRAKGGKREGSWKNSSDLSGANEVTAQGRWPANTLLVHSPECSEVGCVEGCPCLEINQQSGDVKSTLTGRADPSQSHSHPGTVMTSNSGFLKERTFHSNVYADSGGASRFFQCFDGVTVRYLSKANRKASGYGQLKIMHPTLKPLALMQYLVKLVTPHGGVVLDPYAGSATTCHAALAEGYDYIGVERDAVNYAEARWRMDVAHEVLGKAEDQSIEEEVMQYFLG